MIKLDVSKAIKLESLNKLEGIVEKIHNAMEDKKVKGFEYLGWNSLPININHNEISKINKTIKFLRKEKVEVLVVIGIGGSYLGAKAGIEMINGLTPLNKNTEVLFAGTSISPSDLIQKLKYVENKNFAINVISKSGKTLEPALAFRYFKKLLEEKRGKAEASTIYYGNNWFKSRRFNKTCKEK